MGAEGVGRSRQHVLPEVNRDSCCCLWVTMNERRTKLQ